MVELPSNIFCQFANCTSIFIVHHRASDILEASNHPHKRGHKKGNEATKIPGSDNDPFNHICENNLVSEDVSSGGDLRISCCGVMSTKQKIGAHKEQKTEEKDALVGKYNNYNKRIMMQPVILPCNHGYCQECITQMTDMTCHVCARAFTYRETKVNKFLQQICDWFGENRTFISLLLGTDITQSTSPYPPRLYRSASSDITRHRTFSSTSPTRSNSSDSIGSMKDEDIEEPEDSIISNRTTTDNGNNTRLAKFQIYELSTKTDDSSYSSSPLPSPKPNRFAILSGKVLSRGSPDKGTKSSPSGLFHKFRSKKEEVPPVAPLPPLKEKEEDVISKSKSDGRLHERDHRRESTEVSPLGGVLGMHKRNLSAVVSSNNEKVTAKHKSKSKSFSTTVPSIIPSPPALRPGSTTSSRNHSPSDLPHKPNGHADVVSSPPSSPMRTSSPHSANFVGLRVAIPPSPSSPKLSTPTSSTPKISTPTAGSPATNSPTAPPPPSNPFPSNSPIPVPFKPARPSTSEMASVAASFLPAGAGATSPPPLHLAPTPAAPAPTLAPTPAPVPVPPPPFTSRQNRPSSTPALRRQSKSIALAIPADMPFATSRSAVSDTPESNNSNNSNYDLNSPKGRLRTMSSGGETNPIIEVTQHDVNGGLCMSTAISTVPNSAYARPIKLPNPSNCKPQANLGHIFMDPMARKLEFKQNRRVTPMLSKRATIFFEPPSQLNTSSEIDALRSIAMYLPTEVMEMGVMPATKDPKCISRAHCRKHPCVPPKKPNLLHEVLISSSPLTLKKRLSLPNMPLPEDPSWPSGGKSPKKERLVDIESPSRKSSLSISNENPPLILHPVTPPLSSSSPAITSSTSPSPSSASSTQPVPITFTLLEPPSPFVPRPHGKIGSIFMSKIKYMSNSSDDLKRLSTEDALKLQGRNQTLADINKMTKMIGVELDSELLQWTTKMDNYKRYKWTTDDVARSEGPPLVIKSGWNVEYKGNVPWTKLNFEVEDKQKDVCWYHEHFYKKPHSTYLAGDEKNPLFIAVDTDGSPPYKVLLRSTTHDDRLCILDHSKKYLAKVLELDMETTRQVKETTIRQEMSNWDMKEVSKNLKFGLLYCKAGQRTEEEIFSNTSGSPEYEQFLACIGDKITLRGWQKFAGGLAVDSDFDGKYSIFAEKKQFEIMFHVGTYLSHNSADEQYLAKKKHIGNDVVVLVFMDADAPPLDPSFMRTHFTHVYIVVQPYYPDPSSKEPRFRVSVAGKDGVRPFGPTIPQEDFKLDPMFKSFLLFKLINAERAALASPVFQEIFATARRLFLSSLLTSCK